MSQRFDIVVVGAGVFGAWTALRLRQAGRRVALLDQYGAGNSRSSSGDETRIIRMNFGADELYARWSARSLQLWQEFFEGALPRGSQPLFHRAGVLWLAKEGDRYTADGFATLQRLGIPAQRFSQDELRRRWPQIAFDDIPWGFLEPESGGLMARRAVQAVVQAAVEAGVHYQVRAIAPPNATGDKLSSIRALGRSRGDSPSSSPGDEEFSAEMFVFACGPWLPKVFPQAVGGRMFPTRQEVFFFGAPANESRLAPPYLPIWLCHADDVYGFPDLDGRGLKISLDRHGPAFDPDTGSRLPTATGEQAARAYIGRRFPPMKDAPMVEARVCQYENTWNGDFLIDRHPEWRNVWLCGGGSGHGFKHGPMVGEYTAAQVLGTGTAEPRFSLASKQTQQHRGVY